MPRPENFEELQNAKVIYTGILNKYRVPNIQILEEAKVS